MTGIDPRLRKRRIAVRRAEGRRRLRVLISIIVLAAAAGGAYALTRSPLLDLDTIEVDGVAGDEADTVRNASGLELGAPLLDLDLGRAAEMVTALPWVRSAQVDRAWPGTVTVAVERRLGVALLPTGDGGAVVIDGEGVAIARSETSAAGDLPVITLGPSGGLGDVQTLALPALELIAQVPPDLERWIETYGIAYTGIGAPSLTLDLVGSATVELGDDTQIVAKLESVRSTIAQVDLECLLVIDVRVGGQPALSRDPGCENSTGPEDSSSE